MSKSTPQFERLLQACHVQASYEDVSGNEQRASDSTLLALLQALGVGIHEPAQAGDLLRLQTQERLRRGVEPVHLAWDGAAAPIPVYLPEGDRHQTIRYTLSAGSQRVERSFSVDQLARGAAAGEDLAGGLHRLLPLPAHLPMGYHSLNVCCNGKEFYSTLISAPRVAFCHEKLDSKPSRASSPANEQSSSARGGAHIARNWGCFLPLYALRSERDWGVGDFTALAQLTSWIGHLGGSDCATLPLLAAFLDEPLEPSPYRPVSRLFWNELYIDVETIPEFAASSACRQLAESGDIRRRLDDERRSDLVDYARVMKLKRAVLERLAQSFFDARPPRFAAFEAFVAQNSAVQDYAQFRAVAERDRRPWFEWPERLRNGSITEADYDPALAQYHLYVQWIVEEQLSAAKRENASSGCGLYLDLPVGVDPRGYDAWRYQNRFIRGASVGAPPDILFTSGQDWGLPPFHPQRIRDGGYDLLRQVLANNMRFARRLRIDHVLGFHRLYCIPPGLGPNEGAYIRYHADEMYAVAILESHRHQCALVGENLGTVPPEVDQAMTEHGIAGMWVAPYELEPGRRAALTAPPRHHVAMLNTHDMPPLAAWWKSDDIKLRLEVGLIDGATAEAEREQRRKAIEQLYEWLRSTAPQRADGSAAKSGEVPLRALLRALAASPAHLLLINLEDLWLERRPQNIPGNFENQPNWRRKARYRLEQLSELPEVLEVLTEINALRKTKEQPR